LEPMCDERELLAARDTGVAQRCGGDIGK
jgi:hypothetical protein